MKIIGPKDYYDYLSGIYGIDSKIVLDRSKSEKFMPIGDELLTFYICGRKIQGLYYDGEFYYGDKLEKIGKIYDEDLWYKRWYHSGVDVKKYAVKKKDQFGHRFNDINFIVESEIYMDPKEYNKKENCPILFSGGYKTDFYHYPMLSNFKLGTILPPEVIYQWLVEWFSNENSKKENNITPMTNIEKLEAKGFDKKTSFRNIK